MYATVSGGEGNTANLAYSTVPGGRGNQALGEYSFAAGRRAKVEQEHDGTFVWSDSTMVNPDYFISTGNDQFLINATGGVGIGTNDPSEMLDVNGTARLRVMSIATATPVHVLADGTLVKSGSSRRYKTGFEDLRADPDTVLKLNPVRFQWKTTGQEDIGLIAEEVDKVLKDLVVYDNEGRPEAVKYDRVALYLLGTVKAQQERIAGLEARLAALEQPTSGAATGQQGGAR